MNILHKYVNPLVRKYLNSWTALHMGSGAMIGFVLQHLTSFANYQILFCTFVIALAWEVFELSFYKTLQAMYKDYGGKHIWQVDTLLDVIVALLMSAMVIY